MSMEIIDIKIYVGESASTITNYQLPTCISVFDPYIKWQLPSGFIQNRFAVKITCVDNPQVYFIYKSVSPKTQFQIPLNNGFNNKWVGLCFIQIQISQNINYTAGDEFQYTSGSCPKNLKDYSPQQLENPNGFFVIDPQLDSVSNDSELQYIWQKSIDENIQQSLIYHLQVASHPLFRQEDLIINQADISGGQSSYIYYSSFKLDVGTYYFRVRAFDYYDYSQWSTINAFYVKRYSPPILKNLTYEITNNQHGDIIISFQTQCQYSEYTSVVLNYATQDNLTLRYPCTLKQTSHILPVGKNTLTWMSAYDIKSDCAVYLYAFAYCQTSYSETISVKIELQNLKYSISDSSVSNINVNFNIEYYLKSLTKNIIWFPYIGWNQDLYIHKDCSCRYCNDNEVIIDNSPYFKLLFSAAQKRSVFKYTGWDSQINNKQKIVVKNQLGTQTKYIYQINDQINKSIVGQKYLRKNNVFNRIVIGNGLKDFCLYADGRNFCRIDNPLNIIAIFIF